MAADAMKRCRRGFTLIELMVVVTVVSILASIALPSYQNSVRKTRRTDARIALTELAHKLERCQTQFGSYDDPACSIASPDDSPGGHYQLTVIRDAGSFTVSATIQGVQTDDRHCASFSLDSRGERRASDGDGSAAIDCW